MSNLDAPKKYVYQPCAEVCGMVLDKLHQSGQQPEEFDEFKGLVLDQLKTMMKKYGSHNYKWIDCLHRVANHYMPLASDLANYFVYGLNKANLPRDTLSQCLELLPGTLPYLKDNVESSGASDWVKELGMIGVANFIKGTNHRYK